MGLKNPQKYQQDDDQYDDYQDRDELVQDTLTSFTFLTAREAVLVCLSCTRLDANNARVVTPPNPAGPSCRV